MGTPVPRQSPRSPPRGNPLSGPQVKLASFSPSLAAETRPRLGSSAGGGRPGPSRGAEPGVAWGAEPGRLLSPALIPPAPAPRQLQREGKEGRGLRVSAGAGPSQRDRLRQSGVLAEGAEFRSLSFSECFTGRPACPKAGPGSLQRLKPARAPPVSFFFFFVGAANAGAKRGGKSGRAGGSFGRGAAASPRRWTLRWFRSGLFWRLSPKGGMQYSGCELVTR